MSAARKCKCGKVLKVRHTYKATGNISTQDAYCEPCDRSYTFIAFLVPLGETSKRGEGAYAVAQRLKKRAEEGDLELPEVV